MLGEKKYWGMVFVRYPSDDGVGMEDPPFHSLPIIIV